jgi:hypothetical protein
MKAVIYHANARIAENFPALTYEKLIAGLKANVNAFGMPLVHLTLNGHQGFGDENYYFDGDPADIVWNREKCFIEFLKNSPKDTYWFTEPDARIIKMFPGLSGDLALLRRNDGVALNPAWRLAKPSALAFFEEVFSYYPKEKGKKEWHGDSVAWVEMWNRMGKPNVGQLSYNNIKIDLRVYDLYCRPGSEYTTQWKAHNKLDLLKTESD